MPHPLRDVLRRLAVVFVALALTSCGGSSSSTDSSLQGDGSDAAPNSATTAVEAGAVDSPDSEDREDIEEVDETFTEENGEIEPLSGRVLEDESLISKRAIAAKIDNDEKAWPQDGLDEADIVYEIAIENKITRFLAIFHSTSPEITGPVRSARSSDIDLLAPLGNPLFAYSGSNDIVGQEVRGGENAGLLVRASYDDITAAYEDEGSRPRPHQRMLIPERMVEDRLTNAEATVRPVFRYLTGGEETNALSPTAGVRFTTNQRTPASYVWDANSNGWLRYQGFVPHLAGSGQQITPANVVALEVDYTISRADASSPQAITTGTGKATVFTEGGRIDGAWHRATARNGFDIVDNDGEPVRLSPGQTFVQLMRSGEMTVLDDEQAGNVSNPLAKN